MKRKEFMAWNAALLGSLVLPFNGRAMEGMEAVRAAAAAGDEEALWETVRDQFLLDPSWTYVNFGGLGACPLPVLNSLVEWNQVEERAPNADHDKAEWNRVKEKLARLLSKDCRKEDLALVSCATEGVNVIVNGLPLKKGDEIITSTHEHVTVNTALLNRMQKDGIVIRMFEPDLRRALGNVDRVAALVNGRTKLILISHVTCTTGQRFPEKDIARLAHEKGVWFALDGAQAPVNVPFDIVDCGVDFYACSTHKWLMGPKRTGFLYIRQGLLDVLRPQMVGMTTCERYDIWNQEMVFQPTAQRFEFGTQNDALFYGLGKACDFVQAIGPARIRSRGRSMAERFIEGLKSIPGVENLVPAEEAYRSCIVTFRMKTHDFEAIYAQLLKDKIMARRIQEGRLNAIRVSFFLNNRMEDVTTILKSLKKLAAT
jgi:cysteine desulfurase / selenocysteine lyase